MEVSREFVDLMESSIGKDVAQTLLSALDAPAGISVRLNPFKSEGVALPILDGAGKVAWSPYGFLLKERPVFTLHPLFHSGVYYVQDSSAMYVGEAFRRVLDRFAGLERPLRVLDLCAAPGGKTTDLAASLRQARGDSFILVANEVMRNRATVLADNVARWGDPNVVVTSSDPKAFARMEAFFDIIVADVPCSGEGMFRKDEEALHQWSLDNVNLCRDRQRRIVADVWPALSGDGVLIYSTCTFNKYENAGNVDWICRELGAERILDDKAMIPGFVPGEGQFCAALIKNSGVRACSLQPAHGKDQEKPLPCQGLVQNLFDVPVSARQRGDLIVAVPRVIRAETAFVEKSVHPISSGCAVGRLKGSDLVPDEDLALCIALKKDAFVRAAVDKQTALAFLHKDAVTLEDTPKGIILLTYKNIPLGFVKNLGNRTNNLHPQNRRIRMDII